MADGTKIEWCDATWNVITGCSIVSPGCANCYAMRLAGTRLREHPSRAGLTKCVNGKTVWTGEVRFNEQWLTQPLRWRKPRKIFVCAHGDLFHPNVPDEWIDRVFAVMALAPQHTFMVLTKRSARMHAYMTKNTQAGWMTGHACGRIGDAIERMRVDNRPVGPTPHGEPGSRWWPLPNVMLGVTAEDQTRAAERIPHLLATPVAKRFVSIEPMLSPVDLRRWLATANVTCKKCNTSFWLHEANPCKHAGGGGWTLACPNCGDCKCTPSQDDRGDPVTWSPPASWKPKEIGRFDRVHPTIDVKSWLDLVICGGESGLAARPIHPDWARSLRDQCKDAGVPFFFKQWGEWMPIVRGIVTECYGSAVASVAWPDGTITHGNALEHGGNGFLLDRVGKARAGRCLDGEEHNGEA